MLLKIPRWPANVISSPSGPWTMLTPGVRVRRSSNLRPRMGRFSTVSSFSVVAAAVRVDSMTRGVPETVTVSDRPETFMAIGKVIVCPTVSSTLSCTCVANPVREKFKR